MIRGLYRPGPSGPAVVSYLSDVTYANLPSEAALFLMTVLCEIDPRCRLLL